MRIADALSRSLETLAAGGLEQEARFEAEVMLAELLGVDRLHLRAHGERELDPGQLSEFEDRIRRRAAREPAAHILGYRDFHRHRFQVSPAVLIPRPETEFLVDLALGSGPNTKRASENDRALRLLDLCTGSGCIGVTLLQELNAAGQECDAVLTDLSRDALAVARRNLVQVAPEFARRCRLYEGDLDQALPEPERILGFDLIVSNPPYIGPDEKPDLEPEVRDYEPEVALFHNRPVELYRRIFSAAQELLTDRGRLLVELGPRYAEEILATANQFFEATALHKDYAGHDRVLAAHGPRKNDRSGDFVG